MLHMEVYPALPTEAASIRKEVFMEEQGFVEGLMRSTIRLGILWCSTEKFRLEPAAFIGTRRETLMFWEELQSEKPSVVSLWV